MVSPLNQNQMSEFLSGLNCKPLTPEQVEEITEFEREMQEYIDSVLRRMGIPPLLYFPDDVQPTVVVDESKKRKGDE